ncbi:MAG TPA: hypothetical protein VLV16_04105 [Gemmatimonadales bacterium]|nr:hypothetical protein [Gemmatimonadales bacterium]
MFSAAQSRLPGTGIPLLTALGIFAAVIVALVTRPTWTTWLRVLAARVRAIRQHLKNRRTFSLQLFDAVKAGRLTPDDVQRLDALKSQLELTSTDVERFRVKAYLVAYSAVKQDRIVTREEEIELDRIQSYLGVVDSEVDGPKKELEHFRLLREIESGNLPTVVVPELLLQKQETAHWTEPASLLEERVVNRRYVGGSSGVSFRIARGVSYRVGSFRGHVVSDKKVIPVSIGTLVITSKRFVFLGDKKSLNSRLDKLLDVHLFADGIRVDDSGGKPHTFRFESRNNVDVFGAILSRAINSFA